MRRLFLLAAWLSAAACATTPPPPPPTTRELVTRAFDAFARGAPVTEPATVWLTNQDDNDCNTANPSAPQPTHPLDALVWETLTNRITEAKYGRLLEAHRHNYARTLKVDSHRTVELDRTGPTPKVTSMEDLCLLDEAKKRAADKVLVYEVLAVEPGGVLLHLRLSDATSGVVEASRTLWSRAGEVEDRSNR